MCDAPSPCGTPINRREFVTTTAAALAGASLAPLAHGQDSGRTGETERAVRDPKIEHGPITFDSGDDEIDGYLAQPKRSGKFPGIVVIPGNWIVEPYIPEFAAQLAQAGFAALVVNVYHQFPKVASWEEAQKIPWEETQKIIRERWTDARMLQDVGAAVEYLGGEDFVTSEKVALAGFCGGGWNAILFAADHPESLSAVVAFYAPPDAAKQFDRPRSVLDVLPKLRAPLQAHFGTRDAAVPMADIERFKEAAPKLKPPAEVHLYDAQHGFMAYNRTSMFVPAAAKQAFERMTEFLRKHAK